MLRVTVSVFPRPSDDNFDGMPGDLVQGQSSRQPLAIVASRNNSERERDPETAMQTQATVATGRGGAIVWTPRYLGTWEWDGPRKWVVKARFERCVNVKYDLAETWGLVWALRARLVAGNREAASALADKDLTVHGASWPPEGGKTTCVITATLNRAAEHVSLVIGERARSDLIERRIAVGVLCLRGLQICDDGSNPPPPRWIHLEKPAHFIRCQSILQVVSSRIWGDRLYIPGSTGPAGSVPSGVPMEPSLPVSFFV